MEISVLILSCVILGLNPVLPVLLYFFNITICNLIWILPNKIHTYIPFGELPAVQGFIKKSLFISLKRTQTAMK